MCALRRLGVSRKRCDIEKSDNRFFSLVDYKNNLFTSNLPTDVIDFYDSFNSREELIDWMGERPKGASYIHEIEGKKEIVVVILTADFNGKYAMNCRNNIFRGLHMIFVESGEIPDPYFNGSKNVNQGFRLASKYNPKWIIYSSDDMIGIDDVTVLESALKEKDHHTCDIIFTDSPSKFHSCPVSLSVLHPWTEMLLGLMPSKKLRFISKFNRKFEVKYHFFKTSRFLGKTIYKFINFTDFAIFSGKFVEEQFKLYNELWGEKFQNAYEDLYLSLVLTTRNKFDFIRYEIGECVHGSFGNSESRRLNSMAGMSYFTYKLENLLIETPGLLTFQPDISRAKKCQNA